MEHSGKYFNLNVIIPPVCDKIHKKISLPQKTTIIIIIIIIIIIENNKKKMNSNKVNMVSNIVENKE